MFDTLIYGGLIVDGTGTEPYRADLGISGDTIAAIGKFEPSMAESVIRADRLAVSPGFIDPHTHSDFTILQDPSGESKIRQGVTTEIGGNCGYSVFPVRPEHLPQVREYTDFFPGKLTWRWSDYNGFARELTSSGIAPNFASHVGHGMLRLAVMGFSDGATGTEQLDQMSRYLRINLEQGALGLSFGLAYAPGCYARREEIVTLARVAKSFPNTLVTVHLRNEGDQLFEAVSEMLELAAETGIAVHLCHHKATGPKNWGKVTKTLEMIDEANRKGLDITCDVYPYIAGNTLLGYLFPKEDLSGGTRGLIEKLHKSPERRRIGDHLNHTAVHMGGWKNVQIASVNTPGNKCWEGKNVVEIARGKGEDEASAFMDLFEEEEGASMMILFQMREEDVEAVFRHPGSMVGSDGKILSVEGPLSEGRPHPRNFGAYPRVIAKYVREKGTLTLPQAIQKMTSLPAQRFLIEKRGEIRQGFYADLTLFDPATIQDKATFDSPKQYPVGIEYVLVNGRTVLEKGARTDARPGRVLKRR
jgi:N-acyl-D-amino-acid deacylase